MPKTRQQSMDMQLQALETEVNDLKEANNNLVEILKEIKEELAVVRKAGATGIP